MTDTNAPYFVDDRHALATGYLAGFMAKAGFKVQIVDDGQGNHTDGILINLSEEYGEPFIVGIRVLPLVDVVNDSESL